MDLFCVSTDVASFRDYPELVRLARMPQEFIAGTKQALAEGTANAARRRAEAANHSWGRQVDQIEEVIASCTVECSEMDCSVPVVTDRILSRSNPQ